HTGSLIGGNNRFVLVNGLVDNRLKVASVNQDEGTVLLQQTGLTDITVGTGDRLISETGVLVAYVDPLGNIPKTSLTTGQDGRLSAYLREYRFDYTISIPGVSGLRIFIDAEGSFVMRT